MGRHSILHATHYLDDFLILGPDQCSVALCINLNLCCQLGFPIVEHELGGPASVFSFLGTLIDTTCITLQFPLKKLMQLKALTERWQSRRCCKKWEVLSLTGQLQHTCQVVKSGYTFLWRMIDLSLVPKEFNHWVWSDFSSVSPQGGNAYTSLSKNFSQLCPSCDDVCSLGGHCEMFGDNAAAVAIVKSSTSKDLLVVSHMCPGWSIR